MTFVLDITVFWLLHLVTIDETIYPDLSIREPSFRTSDTVHHDRFDITQLGIVFLVVILDRTSLDADGYGQDLTKSTLSC